jgi:hypothetical protein
MWKKISRDLPVTPGNLFCDAKWVRGIARLVDDTFPDGAPVRQWVLSLPMQIRYRLAYDGKLLSAVLRIFLRVVNAGPQLLQAKVATPVTGGIVSKRRGWG